MIFWGFFAKFILQLGERLSYKFADEVIVISNVIKNNLYSLYGKRDVTLIYNGVNLPVKSNDNRYLKELNLKRDNYIFALGRFVEEKGFHDLINAFKDIKDKKIKLVIAGKADHKTKYSQYLKKIAIENNVILTGFIKGKKLNELFSNTKLFVLPSYHEGLPIALLEAMSYNVNILVSDISANKEVNLKDCNYFKVGDILSLSNAINRMLMKSKENSYNKIIKDKYNWDKIAKQTFDVYKKCLV